MKKLTRILPVILAFALPLGAHALSYFDPSGSLGLGTSDLKDVVVRVINFVLGLLGLIAVIMVLWGGFMWLTAGGNDENVKKAKEIISAAVIGIIVVLLAWAIVNFVIRTGSNVTNIT